MQGLGLLLGHLVGDYVVQNDWMAKNKTNLHPGTEPTVPVYTEVPQAWNDWGDCWDKWKLSNSDYRKGHAACTVHCLLYTLSVWAFSFWWMPWWGLLTCFLVHWPVDRFRLARKWMENVSGQRDFANGPLSPWSIIVVDNTFHLLTLWVILVIHQGWQ